MIYIYRVLFVCIPSFSEEYRQTKRGRYKSYLRTVHGISYISHISRVNSSKNFREIDELLKWNDCILAPVRIRRDFNEKSLINWRRTKCQSTPKWIYMRAHKFSLIAKRYFHIEKAIRMIDCYYVIDFKKISLNCLFKQNRNKIIH